MINRILIITALLTGLVTILGMYFAYVNDIVDALSYRLISRD